MSDECASSFGEILRASVERIPGAIGAVFTDWEGEPVDQFAHVPSYDIQLMGAHFGLVLNLATQRFLQAGLGALEELVIEGERAVIVVRPVTDQYCVVLAGKRSIHLATAQRELRRCSDTLRKEI